MKRSLSFSPREALLVLVGTCLIAATYGLVRLAYGLFLPDIRTSVSMSSAVAGYVSSGASAAYCAGALVGLVAGDRPRLLVAGALGTAGAGSIGMAIATDLAVFAPFTVLASAGAGLASPGLVGVVGRNLPAAEQDRAQAMVNSGTGPGLVAAGVLALVLPDWRLAFAVSAALTAAAGLGVLLLDRPRPTRGTTRDTATSASTPAHEGLRWVTVLARPALAALLLGAASATVWTYGRALLVSADATGASDTASTVAWMAIGVGGAATVLTARAMSGLPAPRAWRLSCATVVVATAGLSLAPGRPVLAVLACAGFGWGFVAATSALIAWTTRLAPGRTAEGTSLLFVFLVLGQAAGSSAAGALSERLGLPTTFLLAAIITVLAALCGHVRWPRR